MKGQVAMTASVALHLQQAMLSFPKLIQVAEKCPKYVRVCVGIPIVCSFAAFVSSKDFSSIWSHRDSKRGLALQEFIGWRRM